MPIAAQSSPAIEIWPLDRLKPYAKNPRKNDAVVDRMVASIAEFGFKIPVLARSDGTVVDGHLRLKAAHKLNVRDVPVILCDEWTEAQVKAFRLLVNRSVGWAEWDAELLGAELLELKAADFDLELTGFDPGQCVYDPFMGSGTTIIAAESTGRVAFGLEIDPGYVDVCVKRWEDFTGKKATVQHAV